MCVDVSSKIGCISKAPGAIGVGAEEWFFASVDANVALQCACFRKGMSAFVAHVRSFSCMSLHVSLEAKGSCCASVTTQNLAEELGLAREGLTHRGLEWRSRAAVERYQLHWSLKFEMYVLFFCDEPKTKG